MTPGASPPAPPAGMAAATAAYTAGDLGGSKGSARSSFRASGRVSLSARPASSAPVGHTAGSVATTSAALGLRRTSWQQHLPPRLQRLFTKIAVVMDGGVVLCVIVLATLAAIFLEDIKGHRRWDRCDRCDSARLSRACHRIGRLTLLQPHALALSSALSMCSDEL